MAESESPHGEDKFGFLVRKIGPLPVWAWGAIIVGIYYWYTHYGPGSTTAATGTAGTTGNVTETLNTTTGPTTVNESSTVTPVATAPTIAPPKKIIPSAPRKIKTPVHTPPRTKEPRTVTVAKWPGKSSNGRAQWNTTLWGISQHEHVPLKTLEKANPQVKNPNLVYPGEKINIP